MHYQIGNKGIIRRRKKLLFSNLKITDKKEKKNLQKVTTNGGTK